VTLIRGLGVVVKVNPVVVDVGLMSVDDGD
jgi:hypothetical protein